MKTDKTSVWLAFMLGLTGGVMLGLIVADFRPTPISTPYQDNGVLPYRDSVQVLEEKIRLLQDEAITFQIAIHELKTEKRQLTKEYEKVISSIDTFTVSQLQGYFTARYGSSPKSTASTSGGQGPQYVGLLDEDL